MLLPPRRLTLFLFGALFVAAGSLPRAAADEDPAPAPVARSKTITWIDGWKAGRAEAATSGRLIFLYFTRKTPK